MKKPHVLILPSWYPTPENPLNGIFFYEQAKALRAEGVKVGVVYPQLKSLLRVRSDEIWSNPFRTFFVEEEGIPTLRGLGWFIPKFLPRALIYLLRVQRLVGEYVKRFGVPDLVHAHSALWGGVAALRVQRTLGVPYVLTEHFTGFSEGTIDSFRAAYAKKAFSEASLVIAVSKPLAETLKKYSVEEPRLRVVPNMVDVSFFTLPPKQRQETPFRFLTVAFLERRKGMHILLQAFAIAFGREKHVRLMVGGDGPQRSELEELARRLGIADQVVFLGLLSREGVREAMWQANVFVLPSLVETFGVVLIEALSTGLPVVATRCGGPEDIVRDGVGVLCDPGDVHGLANALAEVYKGYPVYRKREAQIRQYAVDAFSSKAVARSLLEIYEEVLSGGRR
jgi:glycosyltransferase involved in cell wall biosynthesis